MISARVLLPATIVAALIFSATSAQAGFEPGLNKVGRDKGEIYRFGCLTGVKTVHSPRCYFGDLNSKKNLVVFGDSHAMQWGPGLIQLAKRKNWRVIALTRASCSAALVKQDPGCNIWRKNSLKRIRRMKAGLVVVVSAANDDQYKVFSNGYELDRTSSQPYLVTGMVRTLRKLRANSKKTVLIRDQSVTPFNVTNCLRGNQKHPERCGFVPIRNKSNSYDYIAARHVGGIGIVDPMRMLCPRNQCRPVIQNKIVYRNQGHISATFARSKSDWLDRKLGDPWRPSHRWDTQARVWPLT